MYRLLLMCCISTVLTISEAANVAKRFMECARLKQCPPYTLGLEILASLSLPDEEQYEQLCRKNDELQKCFDDNKGDCEDDTVLNNVMKGAQVLDFICSAEGKKVLDSISDSLCVKDQITLLSAKKEKKECNLQLEWQLTANLAKEEMEPINVCSKKKPNKEAKSPKKRQRPKKRGKTSRIPRMY